MLSVQLVQLAHGAGMALPSFATPHSAGADLRAAIHHPIHLQPGDRVLVPTGICIALPTGYEAQVRPRSGLALKKGITIPNAPGTIDTDYRGEIKVILQNAGREVVQIKRGDRVAQLVVARYEQVQWEPVEALNTTLRNDAGFGSTGQH